MLTKIIMYGSTIAILSALTFVLIRLRGHKRFALGICLSIALIVVCILNNYPIDNLIFTFPTPEDVASYVCPNKLIGIADGKESALIVYQDKENSFCTMISPKTENGYKVGGMGSDITKLKTTAGDCQVTIRESRRCTDRYVVVFGIVPDDQIEISDSVGSQFTIMSYPFSEMESSTLVCAYAYLEGFDAETYRITVSDERSTSVAMF